MKNPWFCNESAWNLSAQVAGNRTTEPDIQLFKLILYSAVLPLSLLIGITGNIFNLITLQAPGLQTVPFMYIRAIAFFDLFGLVFVLSYSLRVYLQAPQYYWLTFFRAHVELTCLNSFFCASLYTAVILTIQRLQAVRRPIGQVGERHPRFWAGVNIAGAFLVGLLLHLPMSIQWTVRAKQVGAVITYSIRSSRMAHCPMPFHPIPAIYFWYKQVRESVRILGVALMAVLNVIITRHLQMVKKRRERMILKCRKKHQSAFGHGFTEKRLTVMMGGITVIYVLGNAPQAVIMVLSSDLYAGAFWFQVFRGISNLMEIINHCLNFYIFCITSREYSANFLQNCLMVRRVVEALICRPLSLRSQSTATQSSATTDDRSPPEPEQTELLDVYL